MLLEVHVVLCSILEDRNLEMVTLTVFSKIGGKYINLVTAY